MHPSWTPEEREQFERGCEVLQGQLFADHIERWLKTGDTRWIETEEDA